MALTGLQCMSSKKRENFLTEFLHISYSRINQNWRIGKKTSSHKCEELFDTEGQHMGNLERAIIPVQYHRSLHGGISNIIRHCNHHCWSLLEAVRDGEIHEDDAHKVLKDNIAKIIAFIKDIPNQSWERGNRDWTGRKLDVLSSVGTNSDFGTNTNTE